MLIIQDMSSSSMVQCTAWTNEWMTKWLFYQFYYDWFILHRKNTSFSNIVSDNLQRLGFKICPAQLNNRSAAALLGSAANKQCSIEL